MLKEIKSVLGIELSEQPVAVSLATMTLEDGATTIEAEEFAPDFEVFIITEEDRIPMPVGEYTLEDGMILVVENEGIIMEIKEAVAEEAPAEEAPVAETAPEADVVVEAEAETASPKKVVESITKEMFFSEIEKLRNEIAELKSQKEIEVKVEESIKEELSTPAAKPIKHSPENGKTTTPKGKLSLKELLNTLNK